MPGNHLPEPDARHPLLIRGAGHGAVIMLAGLTMALTAPAVSGSQMLLAAALLGAGAGLMLIQVAGSLSAQADHTVGPPPRRPPAPTWHPSTPGWQALGRHAVAAGGFGLAAAASYLAIGWIPLIVFVGAALVAAGWAQVQYLRSD